MNRTCRAIRREKLCLGSLLCELPSRHARSHPRRVPPVDRYYRGNDFTLSSCFGQPSPSKQFCLEQFAILLEIDEYGHRSYTKLEEAEHIEVIRRWVVATQGLSHLYVLRVNPDGRGPMYKKTLTSKGEQVWKPTEHCA